MSTTTIRIDDELKARVAAAAHHAGQTTHAFILDAIAKTVEQAEFENALLATANARWASIQTTGHTIPWDAAKTYLTERAAGQSVNKPAAK